MENIKFIAPPYVGAKLSDISQLFNNLQIQGGSHIGVDFAPKNAYGKFLLAPELCEVNKIVTDDTFGNNDFYPKLERGYGIVLQSLINKNIKYMYWHCCQVFPVRVGQIVQQGQVVAQMGNSGQCYSGGVYVPLASRSSGKGSHLHYERRDASLDYDITNPLTYIDFTLPVKLNRIQAAQQIIVAMSNLILGRK